jgi:hypothetical protein
VALPNDPRHGQIGSRSLIKAMALPEYTVASVPSASLHKGRLIYVSNGAAGQPCLAFSNGTAWLRVLLGAAVAAA